MNFAVPSAIFLAAIALPIIAFYILKVRMRRIDVSTNLFWKQIFEEKPPRSIWQNFRHLFSLMMQLLFLSALVLAFADPYFPWQVLQARRLVLVVDPSASMKATDIQPSRFEAAKEAGKSILNGLRFRDELAIVVAGRTPEVAIGMTSHVPTLTRVLNGIKVSDSPTSLEKAIELGKQLVGAYPHGQVIVLTDACAPNLRPTNQNQSVVSLAKQSSNEPNSNPKPADAVSPTSENKPVEIDVQYRVMATEASNVGIHQFQVRRSFVDPIGYEVLAGVYNASDEQVKCRLELSLNDAVVDVIPIELQPNEKWSRSIEKTSLQGGRLLAQLTRISKASQDQAEKPKEYSGNDPTQKILNHLATDDQAWAILPARTIQKVLIITPGNVFLTKVFEANPLVQVSTVNEPPLTWPTDSLIVLHKTTPEILPAGNVLVIDPTGSCDLWELGGPIENPIVTEVDKVSPLMHHVRLDNVIMPKANSLQFKATTKTLAGTLEKLSVYTDVRKADGKCLVLSVDLDESDLAFRTVFPIIVANALGWFAGESGELTESQQTGSSVDIPLEPSSIRLSLGSVELRHPSGSSENIAISKSPDRQSETAESNQTRFTNVGPLNEVGVWKLSTGALVTGKDDTESSELESTPLLAEIAVNLADSSETDLRPEKKFLLSDSNGLLMSGWFSRPLWFYLVAFACCLLTAEWFLYQRRIIT